MALPNTGMDAVPFTPLTAEFLDDMIENIESLSDGTGFATGAITTNTLADNGVTLSKIDRTGLIHELYSAAGITAPGEFSDALRKTFDVTDIPTGALFIVTASVSGGDGISGNVRERIRYNGANYEARSYGQYHLSATSAIILKKVSGQNSLDIYTGGSKNHSLWSSIGQCL